MRWLRSLYARFLVWLYVVRYRLRDTSQDQDYRDELPAPGKGWGGMGKLSDGAEKELID